MSLLNDTRTALDKFHQELATFSHLLRKTISGEGAEEIPSEVIAALDTVFAADKELQEHFKRVNEFQILQTKLENLKLILDGKAKEEDRLFDEFLNKVLRSKRELETEEHKLKKMLAAASEGNLEPEPFLALCERLSLSGGPPEGWSPEEPLYLHRPPYPTEDLMRASLLFQVMNAKANLHTIREEATTNTNVKMSLERPQAEDVDSHEPSILHLDLNPDLL